MLRRWTTRAALSAGAGLMLFQAGCPLGYRPRQFELGFWNELGRLTAQAPLNLFDFFRSTGQI